MLKLTSNQIAYWTMKEQERSNRAREQENIRHNKVDEYNKLIGALDNVFSLGAHAAGGSASMNDGIINQLKSIFGENTTLGKVVDKATGVLKDPISIFQSPGVEPIVTQPHSGITVGNGITSGSPQVSSIGSSILKTVGNILLPGVGGLLGNLLSNNTPNSIFKEVTK